VLGYARFPRILYAGSLVAIVARFVKFAGDLNTKNKGSKSKKCPRRSGGNGTLKKGGVVMGPVPSEDGTYLLKAYSKQGRQIPKVQSR